MTQNGQILSEKTFKWNNLIYFLVVFKIEQL